MKLVRHLGAGGAQPPTVFAELVAAAEESGFDSLFTAEAWGSDALTPLAWWGRDTTNLRLGTSIVQMSGRSPASIALHALTRDHLPNGRFILGMGERQSVVWGTSVSLIVDTGGRRIVKNKKDI